MTNETMAAQHYSTRVPAPKSHRLPVVEALALLQPTSRKRTKSKIGGRVHDNAPIKLARGSSDPTKTKKDIFQPKVTLSVGTGNVRTIMNDYAVKLLVHELSKFRCDIIGIAETHRLGVEEIEEGEFKILASGRKEGAHRSGVALVLSRVAQGALVGYNPNSDRIIMAKFRSHTGELIEIQVYAPTADAEDKVVANLMTCCSHR